MPNHNFAFHGDCFFEKRRTGVSRVALRLLQSINEETDVFLLVDFNTWQVPTKEIDNVSVIHLQKLEITDFSDDDELVQYLNTLEIFRIPVRLLQNWVIFYPFWRPTKKFGIFEISLLHDLSGLHYPTTHSPTTVSRMLQDLMDKSSLDDMTIVPSNQTYYDAKLFGDFEEQNLHLIPHGGSFAENQISEMDLVPDFKYFLYVGSIEPRKGLEDLLEWWIEFSDNIDYELVIVGDFAWWAGPEYVDNIRELLSQSRVRHLGYCADNLLKGLMMNSSGLLYPSIFEGFGLPILDSLKLGVPVLARGCSSMVDFAEMGVIYGDFRGVEMLDDLKALTSFKFSDTLNINLNLKFTWKRHIKEIIRRVQIEGDV